MKSSRTQLHRQEEISDQHEQIGCMEYYRKHNQILLAMLPGGMVLISGGINLSWGIYELLFSVSVNDDEVKLHMMASWFVGVIIGAFVGSILVRHTKRKTITYTASALMVIGGLLFVTLDRNARWISTARYITGSAYGLTFIYTVIHCGEIATRKHRGYLLSVINMFTTCGLLISSLLYVLSNWLISIKVTTIYPNQLTGSFLFLSGILSLIITLLTQYQSPIDLIDNDKEGEAFKVLLRLHDEPPTSLRVEHELNTLKEMIIEDKKDSKSLCSNNNYKPLLRLIFIRLLTVISTCVLLNITFVRALENAMGPRGYVVIILCRLIGESFNLYLVDLSGRHRPLYVSAAITGAILFLYGFVDASTEEPYSIAPLTILSMCYQFFIGFGLSNIGIIYMSEAFPLRKKAFSTLFIIFLENALHICLIALFVEITHFEKFASLSCIFVAAILHSASALVFFKYMPETRSLNLQQCRDIMRS